MKKKKYISPEAEIEKFRIDTVMTDSDQGNGGIEEGGEEVDPFAGDGSTY